MKNILLLEEKLKQGMCDSDIHILDSLLAPELLFTNHLGQLITKQMDIDAHKKKLFEIAQITLSNYQFQELDNAVIVNVEAVINGRFQEQWSENKFRFTRVWYNKKGVWQVVSGHSSIIQ